MSMLSNSLSISQWNLLYTNQITASLTSKLRLKIMGHSLIVTNKVLIYNNNASTKMKVGSNNKVEFNKVKSKKK